jgi:hypothetical protein
MNTETYNVINTILFSVTVIAGIATVIVYYHQLKVMQETLNAQIRFNRFAYRPSLMVNREKLEKEGIIQIENNEQRAAYRVFICSYLFSGDGDRHVVLYREIRQFITLGDPVAQSDILRQDFRAQFDAEDIARYGSPLKTRLDQFFSQYGKDSGLLLVVSVRTPLYEPQETGMFFFRAGEVDTVVRTKWQSIHLPAYSPTFKKALAVANQCYDDEMK